MSSPLLFSETQQDSKELSSPTRVEQGSKEQVRKPVQDSPLGESQDSQEITPGQKTRSDDPPPQPNLDRKLTSVTHSFVYEQVKAVEINYVSLAILEDKLEWLNPVIEGHTSVPEELRIKRKTPALAPGYNFSVNARQELESMYKVHDLAFVRRLRDDLITSVIPDSEANCLESLEKARRRLIAQCSPLELELAQDIFEGEAKKKKENRKHILRQQRQHSNKRKQQYKNRTPQAKKHKPMFHQVAPQYHNGPPHAAWGWGTPPPPSQHWRKRQQPEHGDRFVRAGWRNPTNRR